MVKTARGGYDGKGVRVVRDADEVADWFTAAADGTGAPAARGGEGAVHPRAGGPGRAAAQRRDAHVARGRVGPARRRVRARSSPPPRTWTPRRGREAVDVATRIAAGLGVTGVLAVELFEVADAAGGPPRVLVNELAMRPHNSGHWTIDGAVTSQFEQHLRAVLDLPLGDTAPRSRWTVMANVLGSTLPDPTDALADVARLDPAAKVHLYGKEVRAGRKLGHVNVSGDDLDDVRASGRRRRGPAAGRRVRLTRTGRRVGTTRTAWDMMGARRRRGHGVRTETVMAAQALVGIVMGSDSDWPVMKAAAEALAEFDVPVEIDVVSAHRQPEKMIAYGRSAADRGLRVVIAGAGGAAHLPGMLAAVTTLPVVGVPVPLALPRRHGLAALDRADARRGPRGHRVHRGSAQRRAARGAHPRVGRGRAGRPAARRDGRVPGGPAGSGRRQGRAPARPDDVPAERGVQRLTL